MKNNKVIAKIIGDVHISICETPEGGKFFYIDGTNKNVLPIINYIESSLEQYK